jgi:low temperature requirement protein LtrA
MLLAIEFTGPFIAERKDGGTPWHAHHIAERHSLLAIITLGEGVVGPVATLSAVVQEQLDYGCGTGLHCPGTGVEEMLCLVQMRPV